MTKPIDFYYWPTPNGWKVSIALEEMGLPYALKVMNIIKGDQFEPSFLAISPNNRMPAIVDPEGPDGAPISVFEFGAILQYLGRKSGAFYGSSERERIAIDEWVFWQMANLGPNFGNFGHFMNYAPVMVDDPAQVDYALRRFGSEVNRLLGVMERQLAKHEYLAGPHYSIADMASWGWLDRANRRGAIAQFQHIQAWFDKISERPAVQRGFELRRELADTQPDMADNNSSETAQAREVLWFQTAESVAEAAKAKSPGA